MSRQHLSWQHLSISGISQLLLTGFWWNFKGSFLEPSLTDSDYQVNICPFNICPCEICPYQDYLRLTLCWPKFEGRFLEPFFNRCQPLWWYLSSQHLSWQHLSISGISQLLLSQFWPDFKGRSQFIFLLKFLEPDLFTKFFLTQNFFGPQIFLNLNILDNIFLDHNFFGPYSVWPKNFLLKVFFEHGSFLPWT